MAEFAIDQKTIEQMVLRAVQDNILNTVENMSQDPVWLAQVEKLINQAVTYQTISKLGSIDINAVIQQRVDENIDRFVEKLKNNFATTGIKDQATETQLTIMDDHTVFENNLTAQDLTIARDAVIKNLVVTGAINTDNYSWDGLAASIKDKTLKQFADELQDKMIQDITEIIKISGIDVSRINFNGQVLVEGNRLASSITETNIQKLGLLQNLRVAGDASINETLNINRNRVGINTEEPEMSLSVWDEEVAVNIGKNKLNQAYIGTSRAQGIAIGTNRVPQIEITADGLTQIKKLQVGVHKISHAEIVPGWSGTKGDLVFNSNPGNDRVFAWVCLGAFKWQPLKSAE